MHECISGLSWLQPPDLLQVVPPWGGGWGVPPAPRVPPQPPVTACMSPPGVASRPPTALCLAPVCFRPNPAQGVITYVCSSSGLPALRPPGLASPPRSPGADPQQPSPEVGENTHCQGGPRWALCRGGFSLQASGAGGDPVGFGGQRCTGDPLTGGQMCDPTQTISLLSFQFPAEECGSPASHPGGRGKGQRRCRR